MSSTVLHIEDEDLLIELDDQAQVIETEATMEIVADPAGQVTVEENVYQLEISTDQATIIEVEATSPPVQSPSEEEQMYAKRIDFISETEFYKGEAEPGSAESSAVWRISFTTLASDDDVTTLWASGSAEFNQVWDNRAALSYS